MARPACRPLPSSAGSPAPRLIASKAPSPQYLPVYVLCPAFFLWIKRRWKKCLLFPSLVTLRSPRRPRFSPGCVLPMTFLSRPGPLPETQVPRSHLRGQGTVPGPTVCAPGAVENRMSDTQDSLGSARPHFLAECRFLPNPERSPHPRACPQTILPDRLTQAGRC